MHHHDLKKIRILLVFAFKFPHHPTTSYRLPRFSLACIGFHVPTCIDFIFILNKSSCFVIPLFISSICLLLDSFFSLTDTFSFFPTSFFLTITRCNKFLNYLIHSVLLSLYSCPSLNLLHANPSTTLHITCRIISFWQNFYITNTVIQIR